MLIVVWTRNLLICSFDALSRWEGRVNPKPHTHFLKIFLYNIFQNLYTTSKNIFIYEYGNSTKSIQFTIKREPKSPPVYKLNRLMPATILIYWYWFKWLGYSFPFFKSVIIYLSIAYCCSISIF